MIHFCPAGCAGKRLIYQPSKMRYWCQACGRNFTLREAALVGEYNKQAAPTAGVPVRS